MGRIAALLVNRARLVLAITGVVTLIAIGFMFRLRFNADVGGFITSGNQAGEEWIALQEKYETSDPINVLATLGEGQSFLSKDGAVALVDLRDRLASVAGVAVVGSAIPDANPLTGAPITASMISFASEAQITALLTANPLAELLISDSGRHTMVMVTPSDDGIDLEELARVLGRPLALDTEERTAALGVPATDRSASLVTLEAPDFTLPDLHGRMHSLSDHRGKKVLLIAYASW